MRDWAGKTYWIVGASEGLGRAVAEGLSRFGARLILSARSAERLEDLAEAVPSRARVLPLDVTDQASVEAAVAEAGPVDGLVYLAGLYWPMDSREWNAEQAITMTEVNYIGAQRVVGAVLPQMLERKAGHIVLTGSLSGFRGLPGAQGYIPSKAAVMAMAECLRADLRGTGVDVQLINPGFVKTRLTDKNDFKMPMIMEPEAAAREFVDHMNSDAFARSFPTAMGLIFRGSQFLPSWAYYPLVGGGGGAKSQH